MDTSFIPVEVVPSKTPFGLDQLRRSYKSHLSATAAIAAAPAPGTADEAFPNMFLMPVTTPESAESATRIDLTYMGCMSGAAGSPVLPAQKHDNENAVQSASSSRASDGRVATSPLTIQYYAPASVLSYFSFGGAGTLVASDPTSDPTFISLTVGDSTLAITGTFLDLVSAFFSLVIIETHSSQEIVPGQYWQNTSRKVKSYSPYIYTYTPGAYIQLSAQGTGYTVGNTLSISSGGESAAITVTAVGVSNSITNWTVSTNSFTTAHNFLPASGGSGSGAQFNVFIVT